nr:MAG TPA: tailspike protein [Caudoviricetes sp.]
MADFKQAIEKTLKPFARKVGSDIKGIESKVYTGKPINVVDFGIDNTGATDVTEKLNELFRKVRDENYTEVIFPDGTYKISNKVSVFIPGDRHKYLNIHAQNRYKTILEFHGNREGNYTGLELRPESFTQTRGYNVKIDGFTVNNLELPAEGSQLQSQSIYCVFFTQDSNDGFNSYGYKFYNFTCTNMQYNKGYYAIYMNCGIFDSEVKNIIIEGMDYSIEMNGQYSNNNKIENILTKNCENNISVSIKASFKNIDIVYDDEEIAKRVGNQVNITCYNLSNLSYKGYYDLGTPNDVLTIDCTAGATISDIRLDLKPLNIDRAINDGNVPSFISLSSVDSEVDIINVSNVSFNNFDTNFAEVLNKIDYFAYFNTTIPLSIHSVTESANLKFFQEKGVNLVYDKSGYMVESYNTMNTDFISRPFIGTDRNMNGLDQAEGGKLGAIYIGSSEGTPLQGKGTDYSENTAGVKGDIFTDVDPEKYGHFAYVSTYEHTKKVTIYRAESTIISLTYSEEDKLYTATFGELPRFKNGTMNGKIVNVGTVLENYDSGSSVSFEITAVDEDAKTLTLKAIREEVSGYLHPYSIDGMTSKHIFTTGFRIIPRKVNRMKNMTYVTVPIIHSGATENRPTEHVIVGQMYFDTTLGAPVFWNGTEWIQGNNGGTVDTSSLATKEEIKAIPAANITQDDNRYFVTKYQNKKLQDLYNKGELDNKFTTKTELQKAIAAIPAPTVDTSNLVTKEELNTTLTAINEKLKELRGGNQ